MVGSSCDQSSVAADAAGVTEGDGAAALVRRAVAGPPATMTTATAAPANRAVTARESEAAEMTPGLGLSTQEIDRIGEQVLEEVRRRERVYRGGGPPAQIEGKNVIIADDGLATGYTMIASIQMVRKAKAKWVACAVPVSPADTAGRVSPMVDDFICLHVVRAYSFAVASFYRDFHDMKDSEVLDILKEARERKATQD